MMRHLTVLTLDGCDKCKKYMESLSRIDCLKTAISCDKDPTICDNTESLVKCDLYPMTILEGFSKETIILCLAFEYSQILKPKKVGINKIVVYLHSIDSMFSYVQNLYINNK